MIKTHKELAKHIQGKSILHLNSLGKDSVVCLEWLHNFAKPLNIISVYFELLSGHPNDEIYLKYLKKRYPRVKFILERNAHELSNIADGIYQTPFDILSDINKWEYSGFKFSDYAEDLRQQLNLDYICIGQSKYECMSRAKRFYDKGILINKNIYPIGMMTKQDILKIIEKTNLKLHPSYKLAKTTFDYPSYYKMRSAFIANPEYRKKVLSTYPMLCLDEYRYERLLK